MEYFFCSTCFPGGSVSPIIKAICSKNYNFIRILEEFLLSLLKLFFKNSRHFLFDISFQISKWSMYCNWWIKKRNLLYRVSQHCKPITCNKNRISLWPIFSHGKFSLQGILFLLQGSCFYYRDPVLIRFLNLDTGCLKLKHDKVNGSER